MKLRRVLAACSFKCQHALASWLQGSFGSPENVEEVIQKEEAILYLDGLDELGSQREDQDTKTLYDPRLRFIKLLPNNIPILITCRTEDYMEIGSKVQLRGAVTLLPMSLKQIEMYLQDEPELFSLGRVDI